MRRASGISATSAVILLALVLSGCHGQSRDVTTLRFWAMGREGEVVRDLVAEFEAQNPDLRVDVQQVPWSAAHEKLLTAFVGKATPDIAQLGNTWVSEFSALDALAPLDTLVASSRVVNSRDQFAGIWQTNIIGGRLFGIPWYVDTRVLFYRTDLLAAAGYASAPRTWQTWRAAMAAVTAKGGKGHYGILLPLNEWTQPVILGLQLGSTLLKDGDTRGAFSGPEFSRAFAFYLGLFRDGLAPPVANNEVANLYQEFARGAFAMYITGPWNLGEFSSRLPPELQDAWATAPLPAPEGAPDDGQPGVSLAGGSSLVVFRSSPHAAAAWRLIEFLSRAEQQVRFYQLTGDLPAHRAAWDNEVLAADPRAAAFRTQLENVVATPKIPEWEQIANRVWEAAEQAIRGASTPAQALADLDTDVDRMLAKRRWLAERRAETNPNRGQEP